MNKNYTFSIIMPIYNVEKWLAEAIDSLINQKGISFSEDVQLILVNDCSPDNSETICLDYQAKFKNIIYVKNEKNMGLSNTRNNGLKYAAGKYINFFDPDDTLSPSTLSEIKNFFTKSEQNNIKLAHVSIPLVFFEAASGLHPKYFNFGKKNKVINLADEGYNFILSSASSFYPRNLIINRKFDATLFGEEDTLFNFKLYEKCQNIGYVVENSVRYNYRKRFEGGSQVDQSRIKPQAFLTPIQLIEKVNIDRKSDLFYELCIYELRSRLKTIKPDLFEDKSEYEYIISKYREIISKIPLDFILHKTKYLNELDNKLCFITRIFNEKIEFNQDGYIRVNNNPIFKVNKLPLDIKNITIEKDVLIIDALFNDYKMSELEIVMINKEKKVIKPITSYYTDSCYISKVGDIKSTNEILYSRFEIPLSVKNEYRFYFRYKKNGYIYICDRLRTYSESPFLGNGVFNSDKFKLYSENLGMSVSFHNKIFKVLPFSYWSKLKDRLTTFNLIRKKHKKNKWLRFCKLNRPKYWLFNDRPINANDNAEYFFEYINKTNKKLAKRCYFVLDKNSPDIARMKEIGNVVIQNSFKHKFLYLNAKYIFTSHLATSFFKPISFKFLKYYNDLIESKIIWLQHGITMNDIETGANKFNKSVSKVVTCANFEADIFQQRKFFYPSQDIYQTGFTRYDKLKKGTNKTILVMPTWRAYLSGNILANGLHAKKDGFENSKYFLNYSALLKNEALISALRESGYELLFVIHPGLRQYNESFEAFENDVIKVMKKNSFSYNKLFNNSSLLITDYSSVFFDFAYSQKPCLFFQFDQDDFYGKHYKKGVFDFDTMAPGKVVKTDKELVKEILSLIKNNMTPSSHYLNIIRNTYKHLDDRNCERLLIEVVKNL
ncbi:Putative lipooligosaccharide biosynthesis protein [Actinobacillus lignieresii]|uniref:bifunctional glycosyltransferase/CDP-glycerol:glycerophosphate glycerophosphotransferase n=1 Tax=Actinobacillus lignieresii TaxID=720 RepID=UPI000E16AD74|nr:CDP-glycerol glycerophosphotransferase family protein [Actinobacillus lignieresii]SUT99860.1 Putative lipooligosaccharide biosynthesis protein [Actinobacillus lignieresii]